ncbi:segregation/condensation protein A [Mycoplasma sp. OR1901]|uniref:segregation/condensation protein A n=1 Tax=Mycoplasma sp. OR1901 TaxID=2742195 RepID=UPI001581CF18|nr:segregation/condensation protein A [Mycoplasma sp. OR1901]QKT05467.1 segregation/condensation protein A [Mycoplasma sp. OR1901]
MKIVKKNINYDTKYEFNLKNFDGPLDLLLELIKAKKIDIMDVNLVELATQYIEIINKITEDELDVAGDYLAMAANLINLKSRMILRDPEDEPDLELEEEKQKLIQELIEYEHFKNVREALKTFQGLRQDIFIKKPSDIEEYLLDNDNSKLDGHSSPLKLINVMRRMFERVYAQRLRETKLEKFNLTPSDQFPFIKGLMKVNEKVDFEQIFTQPSINHFVVTLIALLELARQQFLVIHQDEQFDTIYITRGESYNEK